MPRPYPPDTGWDFRRLNRRALLSVLGWGALQSIPNVTAQQRASPRFSEDEYTSHPRRYTKYPKPLPVEELGHRQYIPSGEDIHHSVAWRTVANEAREKLEEFIAAAEISVIVDGQKVPLAEGEWAWDRFSTTDSEKNDQPQWRRIWTYTVPPKEPGTYRFDVVVRYTRPYRSKNPEGESVTHDGIQTHQGKYTVRGG